MAATKEEIQAHFIALQRATVVMEVAVLLGDVEKFKEQLGTLSTAVVSIVNGLKGDKDGEDQSHEKAN